MKADIMDFDEYLIDIDDSVILNDFDDVDFESADVAEFDDDSDILFE